MKLKHLESHLSSLPNRAFLDPKIELEQYPTSVHLAASVVLAALCNNDAGPNTTVLDLGCGVGILGLGCALVSSDTVYLVDCDQDALMLARENVDYLVKEELIGWNDDDGGSGCLGVEIIGAKVRYIRPKVGGGGVRSGRGRGRGNKGRDRHQQNNKRIPTTLQSNQFDLNMDDGIPLLSKIVDTVISNPPFGTKHNEGIDVQFLKTAIRLARRAVYSFHKTSTRSYLIKLISSWGLNVEVMAEMKFDIKNMYKFHKEKVKDVEVDLIRIYWEEDQKDKESIVDELHAANDDIE